MEKLGAISQEARIRGVVVMRALFEEGLTSGNDEFWSTFERQTVGLAADEQSLRDACFEYWFRAGLPPDRAAQMLLNQIPQYKREKAMGSISREQNQEFVSRLAGKLFNYYPENVKEMLSRRALKNGTS